MMPRGLLDSGRTFLLIDGAKVENLAETIYRESPGAPCDSLYRGTELADILEISPWLVEANMNSQLAQRCFDDWKHLGAAIALQSDCKFDELVDHLRGLLIAQLETGDEVLFRFYDPEIARHLLKRDKAGDDVSRILGPCAVMAIQDRRTGKWESFYSNQPSSKRRCEAFSIRDEHLVAMEKAAERTALRKLELHTENYFPHLVGQTEAAEHEWEAVSALMNAAKSRGLSSTRDIALYINTIGWLGHHAFKNDDVQNIWEENSAAPSRAIAGIAEFAEIKSMEGLNHG
ncbi:DUF4123 domain-containing protein [uncultured Marinobacter sp.]|uniref:DUF4123 domain-containing protein n=1 Tax=uncultured Marinobacter sp. TaxID=187379 RepID=UPI00262FF571|nr:DUF4123 domain-containing protein [uncultured Marinobacter sp.]